MFSKRCALDARYVCECRKHKVLGLLWFELVNAVACIDATEGGAGGSMPREHEYTGLRFCRCLRRLRHRLYGFYFVKVNSVFFFRSAATTSAAITFTLQPITWRIGMQPLPDSRHDLLRNAKFFDRQIGTKCWQLVMIET